MLAAQALARLPAAAQGAPALLLLQLRAAASHAGEGQVHDASDSAAKAAEAGPAGFAAAATPPPPHHPLLQHILRSDLVAEASCLAAA